jgi:type II secretory pathway pseudopilin PulG
MTLVELIVVLAIFMVVTGLTIFDYGSFRTSTSLQNLSDDVALSIRKAQSYAVGAYGSNANFSYGYGIHFSLIPAPATDPRLGSTKSFVLYTDVSGDKAYSYAQGTPSCGNPTSINECTELLTISTADSISNISLNMSNNAVVALEPIDALDIYFVRPNLNAFFCYRKGGALGGGSCDNTGISNVEIGLASATGRTRSIKVWTTGQISTQ